MGSELQDSLEFEVLTRRAHRRQSGRPTHELLMKTRTFARWIAACVLGLFLAQAAHGFYDPSLGRWINRDPIVEQGFQFLRVVTESDTGEKLRQEVQAKVAFPEQGALYAYVQNSPLDQIDPEGLAPMLPPGWHGPGQPYDPSSNPFCNPGPPCVAEAAAVLAAGTAAALACPHIPGQTVLRPVCAAAIVASLLAADKLAACLNRLLGR